MSLFPPSECHFLLFATSFSRILDNERITCYNRIAGKILAHFFLLVKTVLMVRIIRAEVVLGAMGERSASNLELVGGSLCLDFVNTVSTRIEALSREYLTSYGEWVAWSHHAGILDTEEARSLNDDAARHPDLAAAALGRAIAVRETLYRILLKAAHDERPDNADLVALNLVLREGLSRMEISSTGRRFAWTWVVNQEELDRMVWPVVRSAADLLTSQDLERVRQCARDGCDWLFLDLSKNQSRRWCSMETCGSRVKSRRYYRRRKQRAQPRCQEPPV